MSARARRDQVDYAVGFGASVRRACALLQVSRSALRYESRMVARDAELGSELEEIAGRNRGYGHRFAGAFLRRRGERAPAVLRSDNGPEFIASALRIWALMKHSETATIEPGKPWQNGSVESFNGTFRSECLDRQWFSNLREAKIVIEQWRWEYNTQRPHSSLGYRTPAEVGAQVRPGGTRISAVEEIVALRVSHEVSFMRSSIEVHPITPGCLS